VLPLSPSIELNCAQNRVEMTHELEPAAAESAGEFRVASSAAALIHPGHSARRMIYCARYMAMLFFK
jgi:hypothetical protein